MQLTPYHFLPFPMLVYPVFTLPSSWRKKAAWKAATIGCGYPLLEHRSSCNPQGCQPVAGGRSAAETTGKRRKYIFCTPEGCQRSGWIGTAGINPNTSDHTKRRA